MLVKLERVDNSFEPAIRVASSLDSDTTSLSKPIQRLGLLFPFCHGSSRSR
jgi:hypothetical protein